MTISSARKDKHASLISEKPHNMTNVSVILILVFWIVVLTEIKTGTAYGRGGRTRRQDSPTVFWLIMWAHTSIVVVLTFYVIKDAFSFVEW